MESDWRRLVALCTLFCQRSGCDACLFWPAGKSGSWAYHMADLRRSLVYGYSVSALAGTALSIVLLGLYVLIVSLVGLESNQETFLQIFRGQIVASIHSEILTYWMVIGLSQGVEYYRKYRERELRASQLEARLAQAQLDALKMQLHPHFLFNTLNSISVLMSEDVTAARRMLTQLSHT
jgi:two-component system LytT family sensor kinase